MMLKKLRRKFIVTAVLCVFAVLFVILGAVNIANYVNVTSRADEVIAMLKEGGGAFGMRGEGDKHVSPETPFATRYFTVTLSGEGEVLATDLRRIAAVSQEEACTYAAELLARGAQSGFYASFRFGTMEAQGGTMYLFVDCSAELGSFYSFLAASAAAGFAGLAVVFVLIFLFSGRILRPVAESYEKQKRFITDAGHEIKTPLTIIGANAEIIELKTGRTEWTQGICEQVARLSSLTEKLIFLARMDEEAKPAMFAFSLTDAVDESVHDFRPVAAARGLELNADVQRGVSFTGNEEMLRRLISLLLDNAMKYADGGRVDVILRQAGGRTSFSVANDAAHLPEGDLSSLFERFRRGDASRNSGTGGHGIGLSVVQAIASAHRGKLSAVCTAGRVVFTVTL